MGDTFPESTNAHPVAIVTGLLAPTSSPVLTTRLKPVMFVDHVLIFSFLFPPSDCISHEMTTYKRSIYLAFRRDVKWLMGI